MKPRYAQENHTHSGLVGGAGEGWSGIVSAYHATAGGGGSALGFSATVTGASTSVDTTVTLSGSPWQKYPRIVRRLSGFYGGVHATTGTRFMNTLRGFHARWTFGTTAYQSSNSLFAGCFYSVPASVVPTTFDSWASTYAVGVWKNAGSNTIDWVWRTDSSTTGSASTGLSWADGEAWSLELNCEPAAAGGVTARLSCSNATAATYTFTSFPDAVSNPAAILSPGVIISGTGTTTQLGLHTMDVVESF